MLQLSAKTPDTIDFSFSDRASKDACFHFRVDVPDVCYFGICIGWTSSLWFVDMFLVTRVSTYDFISLASDSLREQRRTDKRYNIKDKKSKGI